MSDSADQVVIADLGPALAARLHRLWFWSHQYRTSSVPDCRDTYRYMIALTCTELWAAAGSISLPCEIPDHRLLIVGLARHRIAYTIWNSAANVAELDYTMGAQMEQCGAVWLDSAHEISQRLRARDSDRGIL